MKVENAILVFLLMGLTVSVSAEKTYSRHNGQFEQVTTVHGVVAKWTYNDDFEYDGLYLNTANTSVFVKFPPHLGQQVRALGDNLSVNGVFKDNPQGVTELKMISVSGNGQTVVDQKPIPDTKPLQESFVNGEGEIIQLHSNKKGEVCGYILDDGVLLRIPPHVAKRLSQMIQAGSTIGYAGIEKALKPGHVRACDYNIIHCQTISVNGTQYIVR